MTPSTPGDAPDIWKLIFEQTPVVIRWLLGVLTLGIFTMLGLLWRWSRKDIENLQKHQHDHLQSINGRISTEIAGVHTRVSTLETRLDKRLEEMNHHLITIATNTHKGD